MYTPVRKIGIGSSSLRGSIPSEKNNRTISYESGLERDLIYRLEFDFIVRDFTEQPLFIQYQDKGKQRSYTPDFLVTYYPSLSPDRPPLPTLIEVKYRDDLRKNWRKLKPKFKAAVAYSKEQNWRFKILTENEIRTPYLDNIKLLWRHKFSNIDRTMHKRIEWLFEEYETLTPRQVRNLSFQSEDLQDEALYTLWCLIAKGKIQTDLNLPLSMESEIWK